MEILKSNEQRLTRINATDTTKYRNLNSPSFSHVLTEHGRWVFARENTKQKPKNIYRKKKYCVHS